VRCFHIKHWYKVHITELQVSLNPSQSVNITDKQKILTGTKNKHRTCNKLPGTIKHLVLNSSIFVSSMKRLLRLLVEIVKWWQLDSFMWRPGQHSCWISWTDDAKVDNWRHRFSCWSRPWNGSWRYASKGRYSMDCWWTFNTCAVRLLLTALPVKQQLKVIVEVVVIIVARPTDGTVCQICRDSF